MPKQISQRNLDPIFLAKIIWTKIFLTNIFFRPKNFLNKFFGDQKIYHPNYLLANFFSQL